MVKLDTVAEHCVHIAGVAGSSPARSIRVLSRKAEDFVYYIENCALLQGKWKTTDREFFMICCVFLSDPVI